MILQENKIKDIKSFAKMFGLNIPDNKHFDYYIDQLSKTEKYKDIKELLGLYIEMESEVEDMYGYRMDKMKEVVDFIKDSHAYMEMTMDKNLIDLPMNRNITYKEDVKYISVDIIQANWNSLKKYDQFNELGDSYGALLDKFNMPELFRRSKSMRQFIFGNVNPGRQRKVERNMLQDIVRQFSDDFQVEFVGHDEVIFSFNEFEDIKPFMDIDESKWRLKIFSVERESNARIKTIYDFNGIELYKELVGVPGNQFFMKLKECLLNEPLDIRDLYFKNDGKVAVWVVPELKIEIE